MAVKAPYSVPFSDLPAVFGIPPVSVYSSTSSTSIPITPSGICWAFQGEMLLRYAPIPFPDGILAGSRL